MGAADSPRHRAQQQRAGAMADRMGIEDYPMGAADDMQDDPLPDEPWTELGYAHRLIHVYGDRLRYVDKWRRWLVWDGTRWTHDTTGQAARWMKITARRLTNHALGIPDKEERNAKLRQAKRGESSAGISGALTLARTDDGIAIEHGMLDADPFLLNCPNGTLDLRTLELRPHDPADLLTKITRAAYRPDAHGAEFTKFLQRVQPKEEMRRFLARLTGHMLEGRVVEHLLPILYGPGANGKSTYVDAVLHTLGDYADAADPDLLTARSFDAHPTGNADLFGLRVAILHEGDAGRRLAEGTVKRLTGGDRVKARRMREDFWWFDPSHSFMTLTNHKPIITGTDAAIWRRIRLFPWDESIPPDQQDTDLGDRLKLEADAVLAFLVDGYRDWKKNGLADPDDVVKATSAYRKDSDAVGRFLEERCLVNQYATVRSSALYAEWRKWAEREGVDEPKTNKAFTTVIEERGFDKKKTNVGVVWQGLGLLAGEGS